MAAVAPTRPLVDRIVPGEGTARAAALFGLVVLGSLILWASAKIHVPFWPVPMTLQTGAVALIAAAYGMRLGAATVALYLAEGIVGLPVFSGGAGYVYLLGTTGGFLIGFLLCAALVGWFAERGFDRSIVFLFIAMLVGDALVFLLGWLWLGLFAALPNSDNTLLFTGIGLGRAFAAGVVPFIVGDLVKLALAASIVAAGARLVRR
jgi:biotin transport system substrate-specific component